MSHEIRGEVRAAVIRGLGREYKRVEDTTGTVALSWVISYNGLVKILRGRRLYPEAFGSGTYLTDFTTRGFGSTSALSRYVWVKSRVSFTDVI